MLVYARVLGPGDALSPREEQTQKWGLTAHPRRAEAGAFLREGWHVPEAESSSDLCHSP